MDSTWRRAVWGHAPADLIGDANLVEAVRRDRGSDGKERGTCGPSRREATRVADGREASRRWALLFGDQVLHRLHGRRDSRVSVGAVGVPQKLGM